MTDISLSTDETRETWTRVFRYLYKNLFFWTDLPSIFLFSYQLAYQFWDHYSKPSSGLSPRGNRNQRLNDLLFSWSTYMHEIFSFKYFYFIYMCYFCKCSEQVWFLFTWECSCIHLIHTCIPFIPCYTYWYWTEKKFII